MKWLVISLVERGLMRAGDEVACDQLGFALGLPQSYGE
jgi:hypothetical protein